MKKIAFKPLVESSVAVPETFERLRSTGADDLEIQKTPGVWFTRTGSAVGYSQEKQALEIGRHYWWTAFPFFFRGSCEITLPKGFLTSKQGVEILCRGRGWFSLKLLESTVTLGGVRTYGEGSWMKLDTIREKEIFVWSYEFSTRKIYFRDFYNKPWNVELKAFLRGLRPLNKTNVASAELTGRFGTAEIKAMKFF